MNNYLFSFPLISVVDLNCMQSHCFRFISLSKHLFICLFVLFSLVLLLSSHSFALRNSLTWDHGIKLRMRWDFALSQVSQSSVSFDLSDGISNARPVCLQENICFFLVSYLCSCSFPFPFYNSVILSCVGTNGMHKLS